MLEAVVFDFDGVIVDSEPMHHKAFNAVLEPLGKGFSWEDYCETYIGFDDRDAFREAFRVQGEALDAETLKTLIEQKAQVFDAMVHNGEATPIPGAVELIRSLSAELPIALCSGALRSDIDPIITKLGIADAFKVIVTAEDTDRSKPDPAPYCLTLEKLGIEKPENCVAIEDTPAGIASAQDAGMKVLAVTNSYDEDYLWEANRIINSLESLKRNAFEELLR